MHARAVAAHLLRKTGRSYQEVGAVLARHHSSARDLVINYRRRLSEDEAVAEELEKIEARMEERRWRASRAGLRETLIAANVSIQRVLDEIPSVKKRDET